MTTVDLAYECVGEQHPGTPLLILHGFFASSRNWRGIAKQLAANRRVYLLDMRNHGASPQHPLMDYPSMAADVQAFMRTLQITQADLLGHSMGGKVAMWLALQHPQLIRQIIVADIAPVAYQHSFDNTIQALRSLPLATLTNRKQAEEFLAPAIPDLNYRQFLLQNLQLQEGQYCWRVNLDYFAQNAPYIIGFPDVVAGQTFAAPALFLVGELSPYVQSADVYPLFPQAKIQPIPASGHWLHVDAPELFCALINAWLSEAAAPA